MPKYFTQPGSSVIGGVNSSNDADYLKIISANRALLTIDPILAATFAAKQFFYSDAFTLAATSDYRDYLFVTPNTTEWAHFLVHVDGNAITEFKLIEDSELSSSDGTAQTTFNNNRNSTDSADCLLYLIEPASATDSGTQLLHDKSGSATNQSKSSMSGGYADELFLKSNSIYRIQVGTGSASNLCNILVQWHEHTNEG
jgi:hypothetical protein